MLIKIPNLSLLKSTGKWLFIHPCIGLVSLPYHDIMVETEYWWECLIVQCHIWMTMCALLYSTNTPAMMNLDKLYVWWKSFGITYLTGYLSILF